MKVWGNKDEKKPEPKLQWEKIDKENQISRTPILGGWLVMAYVTDDPSLTFVPDPNHEWKLQA